LKLALLKFHMRYTINTGCCRVTTWSASLGITLSGLMNEDQDTGLNDLNAYQPADGIWQPLNCAQ